jgi:hypothetical protein
MMYSVIAAGSETAAGDMLEMAAPADACLVLHSLYISQSTEAGDAASEQLTVSLSRVTGAPTSGSGGSTLTPTPLQGGTAAAGGVYEGFNTTDLTGGTATVLHTESFNVHNGLSIVWTPETRPIISPSTRALLTLDGSPADSVTFQVTAYFEELGG